MKSQYSSNSTITVKLWFWYNQLFVFSVTYNMSTQSYKISLNAYYSKAFFPYILTRHHLYQSGFFQTSPQSKL